MQFTPGCCGCDCEVPIHVTDFCTNVDVSGVVATFSRSGSTVAASAPTDVSGLSSVALPASGTYDVVTSKDGCTGLKSTVAVDCGGTLGLRVWCGSVWHQVCVTAACQGKGAGINVSITFANGETASGVTNGDGCFLFRPTATGTATVTLDGTSGKHVPSTSTINITSLCTPTSYAKTIALISPWTCCFDGTRTWIVKPGVLVTIGAMSGYSADSTICEGSICLTGPADYVADPPGAAGGCNAKAVHYHGTTRCIISWGFTAHHATQQVPHACYNTYNNVPASCTGPQYNLLCRMPLNCSNPTTPDRVINASSMVVDGNAGITTLTFPDSYPTVYDPIISPLGGACLGQSRPISTSCLIQQV